MATKPLKDEPTEDPGDAPADTPAEQDEMPSRFTTGGATAEERAEWLAAHKAKPQKSGK